MINVASIAVSRSKGWISRTGHHERFSEPDGFCELVASDRALKPPGSSEMGGQVGRIGSERLSGESVSRH